MKKYMLFIVLAMIAISIVLIGCGDKETPAFQDNSKNNCAVKQNDAGKEYYDCSVNGTTVKINQVP